jgi:DNA polymerase-1
MAINHPIQGSLADMVKMTMVKIQESSALPNARCSMLLQIHDELLFEIADGMVEEASRPIKELMENIVELRVPLRVDVKKGKNWADVEKILGP